MKAPTVQPESAISDELLRSVIAEALAKRGQVVHATDAIERRPYEYYSSFQMEEVTVELDSGRRISLILKNLSPRHMLKAAQAVRPSDSSSAEREIGFYRDVLASANLETAEYYGSDADVERQRYWLLLEKVRGENLANVGDFEVWLAAAKWLARAHRRLPQAMQRRKYASFLCRYDCDCFQRWIERFRCALPRLKLVDGRAPSAGETSFLIDQARFAAELVDRLPVTIIHGEFYASNVLVQTSDEGLRICPVDWETVGVGPGLLDLAALVAGSWSDEQRVALAEAYLSALEKMGQGPIDRDEAMAALRCCRLLMALKWSGCSPDWRPPPEHWCDWLAEAVVLAHSIRPSVAS
jgi:hypothetical protein